MPINVQWEEPPATRQSRTSSEAAQLRDALKARPGQWAVVAHHRGSAVSQWKRHGFEARGVSQGDGTVKTYARWPEDAPTPTKATAPPSTAPRPPKAPAKVAAPAKRTTTLPPVTNRPVHDYTGTCKCGREQVTIYAHTGRCRMCNIQKELNQ